MAQIFANRRKRCLEPVSLGLMQKWRLPSSLGFGLPCSSHLVADKDLPRVEIFLISLLMKPYQNCSVPGYNIGLWIFLFPAATYFSSTFCLFFKYLSHSLSLSSSYWWCGGCKGADLLLDLITPCLLFYFCANFMCQLPILLCSEYHCILLCRVNIKLLASPSCNLSTHRKPTACFYREFYQAIIHWGSQR